MLKASSSSSVTDDDGISAEREVKRSSGCPCCCQALYWKRCSHLDGELRDKERSCEPGSKGGLSKLWFVGVEDGKLSKDMMITARRNPVQ